MMIPEVSDGRAEHSGVQARGRQAAAGTWDDDQPGLEGSGLHVNVLRKWVKDAAANGAAAFPGRGKQRPDDAAVALAARDCVKKRDPRGDVGEIRIRSGVRSWLRRPIKEADAPRSPNTALNRVRGTSSRLANAGSHHGAWSMARWRVDAKLLQPHEQPRRIKRFAENAKQRIRRAGIGIPTLVISCCKNDRQRR
jgi:hypothetical protein